MDVRFVSNLVSTFDCSLLATVWQPPWLQEKRNEARQNEKRLGCENCYRWSTGNIRPVGRKEHNFLWLTQYRPASCARRPSW